MKLQRYDLWTSFETHEQTMRKDNDGSFVYYSDVEKLEQEVLRLKNRDDENLQIIEGHIESRIKLEQLNAEMLEFIKTVNDISNRNPSLFCEHQDSFNLDSKSIIAKAEAMK